MNEKKHRLLSARVLATNTVWTVAGLVLPALVGLAAIPHIVRGFGVERFGLLTIAWMVIGYFSLFDLGLGRAVTRHVSAMVLTPERDRVPAVLWSAWYLAAALGMVGLVVVWLGEPWLIARAFHVSPALEAETRVVFRLLAVSIPLVVLSAGFRGALEALQRFGLVNAVRIPIGLLTFIVPLATLRYSASLVPTVVGLLVVRFGAMTTYAVMCGAVIPDCRRPRRYDRAAGRELLSFGAWMTVSNVISPMMVSFDRFFVSAMISVAAVTYYATPFEAVSKVLLIPSAITAVLFPAFAAAASDRERRRRLLRLGMRAVVVLEAPIAFGLLCFAPEVLGLWLGPDFTLRSSGVMRWLVIGVFANSIGQLAFGLVQGLGRSDVTAKLHVIEAPLYAALLVVLLRLRGIEGAAIAWSIRTIADMAALLWLSARLESVRVAHLVPAGKSPLVLFAFFAVALLASGIVTKLVVTALFFVAMAIIAWRWGLEDSHRQKVVLRLRLRRRGVAPGSALEGHVQ